MKTEIINVPGKGICILISEIDVTDFIKGIKDLKTIGLNGCPFSNIHSIVHEIRNGKRLLAIKKIRAQTGWGLKEAKQYLDGFIPVNSYYPISYEKYATKFLLHHVSEEFIKDDDFKV